MKKMISVLMMMFMLCSIALAQQNGNGDSDGQVQGVVTAEFEQKENVLVQSKVSGLENAIISVKRESQQQHLEMVMNKIQAKRQQQLNKHNATFSIDEVTDETMATFNAEGKFLGLFKIQKRYEYKINEENGELIRQGRPFVDLFFYDSDSLEWSGSFPNPIGLGHETECDMKWDGTPWRLKAMKIWNLPECEISLTYDIDAVVCECYEN